MRSLPHRAAACALAALLLPRVAWGGMFAPSDWSAASAVARGGVARASQGAGLELETRSELRLSPDMLAYQGGALRAATPSGDIVVPIDPVLLAEAVLISSEAPERTRYTVSIDATAGGQSTYADAVLRDTLSERLLATAELRFSAIVQDQALLPLFAPGPHPYDRALALLDSSPEYAALTDRYLLPPLSWPQLRVSFDPGAVGSVALSFHPEVYFRGVHGQPEAVTEDVEALGDQPYVALREDVRARPGAWRDAGAAIDLAARFAVVVGLVRTACAAPQQCRHLLTPAAGDPPSKETFLGNTERLQARLADLEQESLTVSLKPSKRHEALLRAWWGRVADRVERQIDAGGPAAWAGAYDAVHTALMARALGEEGLEARLLAAAKRQFANAPVPDGDATLAAAHGLTEAMGGDAAARASFDRAWQLATAGGHPGTRVLVARAALVGGELLGDASAYEPWHVQARQAAFDHADGVLRACEAAPPDGPCGPEALLALEWDAARAELFEEVPDRDVAALHGRFCWLTGRALEGEARADRARLLGYYAAAAADDVTREALEAYAARLGGA